MIVYDRAAPAFLALSEAWHRSVQRAIAQAADPSKTRMRAAVLVTAEALPKTRALWEEFAGWIEARDPLPRLRRRWRIGSSPAPELGASAQTLEVVGWLEPCEDDGPSPGSPVV